MNGRNAQSPQPLGESAAFWRASNSADSQTNSCFATKGFNSAASSPRKPSFRFGTSPSSSRPYPTGPTHDVTELKTGRFWASSQLHQVTSNDQAKIHPALPTPATEDEYKEELNPAILAHVGNFIDSFARTKTENIELSTFASASKSTAFGGSLGADPGLSDDLSVDSCVLAHVGKMIDSMTATTKHNVAQVPISDSRNGQLWEPTASAPTTSANENICLGSEPTLSDDFTINSAVLAHVGNFIDSLAITKPTEEGDTATRHALEEGAVETAATIDSDILAEVERTINAFQMPHTLAVASATPTHGGTSLGGNIVNSIDPMMQAREDETTLPLELGGGIVETIEAADTIHSGVIAEVERTIESFQLPPPLAMASVRADGSTRGDESISDVDGKAPANELCLEAGGTDDEVALHQVESTISALSMEESEELLTMEINELYVEESADKAETPKSKSHILQDGVEQTVGETSKCINLVEGCCSKVSAIVTGVSFSRDPCLALSDRDQGNSMELFSKEENPDVPVEQALDIFVEEHQEVEPLSHHERKDGPVSESVHNMVLDKSRRIEDSTQALQEKEDNIPTEIEPLLQVAQNTIIYESRPIEDPAARTEIEAISRLVQNIIFDESRFIQVLQEKEETTKTETEPIIAYLRLESDEDVALILEAEQNKVKGEFEPIEEGTFPSQIFEENKIIEHAMSGTVQSDASVENDPRNCSTPVLQENKELALRDAVEQEAVVERASASETAQRDVYDVIELIGGLLQESASNIEVKHFHFDDSAVDPGSPPEGECKIDVSEEDDLGIPVQEDAVIIAQSVVDKDSDGSTICRANTFAEDQSMTYEIADEPMTAQDAPSCSPNQKDIDGITTGALQEDDIVDEVVFDSTCSDDENSVDRYDFIIDTQPETEGELDAFINNMNPYIDAHAHLLRHRQKGRYASCDEEESSVESYSEEPPAFNEQFGSIENYDDNTAEIEAFLSRMNNGASPSAHEELNDDLLYQPSTSQILFEDDTAAFSNEITTTSARPVELPNLVASSSLGASTMAMIPDSASRLTSTITNEVHSLNGAAVSKTPWQEIVMQYVFANGSTTQGMPESANPESIVLRFLNEMSSLTNLEEEVLPGSVHNMDPPVIDIGTAMIPNKNLEVYDEGCLYSSSFDSFEIPDGASLEQVFLSRAKELMSNGAPDPIEMEGLLAKAEMFNLDLDVVFQIMQLVEGAAAERVVRPLPKLNSFYETGYITKIDKAITLFDSKLSSGTVGVVKRRGHAARPLIVDVLHLMTSTQTNINISNKSNAHFSDENEEEEESDQSSMNSLGHQKEIECIERADKILALLVMQSCADAEKQRLMVDVNMAVDALDLAIPLPTDTYGPVSCRSRRSNKDAFGDDASTLSDLDNILELRFGDMEAVDESNQIDGFINRFIALKQGGHFPDANIERIGLPESVISIDEDEDENNVIEVDAEHGFVNRNFTKTIKSPESEDTDLEEINDAPSPTFGYTTENDYMIYLQPSATGELIEPKNTNTLPQIEEKKEETQKITGMNDHTKEGTISKEPALEEMAVASVAGIDGSGEQNDVSVRDAIQDQDQSKEEENIDQKLKHIREPEPTAQTTELGEHTGGLLGLMSKMQHINVNFAVVDGLSDMEKSLEQREEFERRELMQKYGIESLPTWEKVPVPIVEKETAKERLHCIRRPWQMSMKERTCNHKGFKNISKSALRRSLSVINPTEKRLKHVDWDDRNVGQAFLDEKALEGSNWFGRMTKTKGNDKIRGKLCQHPKPVKLFWDTAPEPGVWEEEWYTSWQAFKQNPNNLALEQSGRTSSNIVDEEEVPRVGVLTTIRLKPGERMTRVHYEHTSNLRHSRWRKRWFPKGKMFPIV